MRTPMPSHEPMRLVLGPALLTLAIVATSLLASAALVPAAAEHPSEGTPGLTLVTLHEPGTATTGDGRGSPADRARLLAVQDAVLRAVGAPAPVYRWTSALNGFAVHLTETQVEEVSLDPAVAVVEANEIRPLAARSVLPASAVHTRAAPSRMHGGAGVVVGVVDTGIGPESPAFAETPGLGRAPQGFDGTCQAGEAWSPDTCSRKVVGARWFVTGFGTGRLRSSEQLSPRDVLGHGTRVASVAAGNAGVTVRLDGRDVGRFSGVAPQARVAAYKACWAAPDPSDDGCSTADLVTAVDRAVGDGVDVLNLSVAGGDGIDTLQLALLGAAEDDVVVIGAAGNSPRRWAAHPAPWVTTVGSTVGQLPRMQAVVEGGPSLAGTGRSPGAEGEVVLARAARTPQADPDAAAQCRPGTLDARQVAGKVVVCERGGLARLDKSLTVAQADGRAMVLANVAHGALSADYHHVPTVHLDARQAHTLTRWVRTHATTRIDLVPGGEDHPVRRTPAWSPTGDPRSPVLKPDVVAAADGVLAAQPDVEGRGWALLTGSSAAAARASGLAALLRSRHDWRAATIRSVLVTTATPLERSSVPTQGSGSLGDGVPTTHLALEVRESQWRHALAARDLGRLNLSSLVLNARQASAVRRVTNIGDRAEYFSVDVTGFTEHDVSVRPLAVRLAPGESHAFRIEVSRSPSPLRLDDGYVIWRGARGGVTRIPVALTR